MLCRVKHHLHLHTVFKFKLYFFFISKHCLFILYMNIHVYVFYFHYYRTTNCLSQLFLTTPTWVVLTAPSLICYLLISMRAFYFAITHSNVSLTTQRKQMSTLIGFSLLLPGPAADELEGEVYMIYSNSWSDS